MENDLYVIDKDQEVIEQFKSAFDDCFTKPNFLSPSKEDSYNQLRKVFNRRFDFMPSLIIQPFSTEHVAIAVQYATDNNIQITVKSGGHDHEGECVATGKVLIDFSLMNRTDVSLRNFREGKEEVRQISIQPGAKFISIKQILDKEHLGILIKKRDNARAEGNYDEADKIRSEIENLGVVLEDKDGKTTWKLR